jgi:hypothetical protein
MDRDVAPAGTAAQQAAIQEARRRYERGELSYDAFRRALDALVLARDADECQAILDALPTTPLAALSALDAPLPSVPSPAAPQEQQRITAFMSQVKKLRRPWKLGVTAHATAFMGEIKLDLRLAELPPRATLCVTAFMGTVIVYVPDSVRVSVRSRVIMGGVRALGEDVSGVIASGHDEHAPPPGTPAQELDIEVRCYMGDVRIILTDGQPTASISELVRDALRAVAEGARRGLREGARQSPALPSRETWRGEP